MRNKEHKICGKRYIINVQHRNKNPEKSQWGINDSEELDLFKFAVMNNWDDETNSLLHALFIKDNDYQVIGFFDNTALHIARFVVDQDLWHGFPCGNKSSDLGRIPNKVILDWKDKKYISNAKANKLNRGVYSL